MVINLSVSKQNLPIRFSGRETGNGLHVQGSRKKQLNFMNRKFSVIYSFNPLSANLTKWSNTLKQLVGKLPTDCLSVFAHFVKLALKGLIRKTPKQRPKQRLSFLSRVFDQKEKLDQFSSIFLFYLWKYGTTHFTINNSWKLILLLLTFIILLLLIISLI